MLFISENEYVLWPLVRRRNGGCVAIFCVICTFAEAAGLKRLRYCNPSLQDDMATVEVTCFLCVPLLRLLITKWQV